MDYPGGNMRQGATIQYHFSIHLSRHMRNLGVPTIDGVGKFILSTRLADMDLLKNLKS